MHVFCYFFKKHDKLIVSFEFYFIFKLYNIVLVLPNIEMNLKKGTDTEEKALLSTLSVEDLGSKWPS